MFLHKHILYVKGKIARGLGIIKKARKKLNPDTLLTLYYSFIYPHINYCLEVWGNSCNEKIDCILKIQKRCVRLLSGAEYRAHSDPLFKEKEILSIHKLYIMKALCFTHKFLHYKLPSVFSTFFIYNSEIHDYSTRIKNRFRPPKARTTLRAKTLRFTAPKLANDYYNDVDFSQPFHPFKKHIHKLLLTRI